MSEDIIEAAPCRKCGDIPDRVEPGLCAHCADGLEAENAILRKHLAECDTALAILAERFRAWDKHVRGYMPVDLGGDPEWDEKEDELLRALREAADLPRAKVAAEQLSVMETALRELCIALKTAMPGVGQPRSRTYLSDKWRQAVAALREMESKP